LPVGAAAADPGLLDQVVGLFDVAASDAPYGAGDMQRESVSAAQVKGDGALEPAFVQCHRRDVVPGHRIAAEAVDGDAVSGQDGARPRQQQDLDDPPAGEGDDEQAPGEAVACDRDQHDERNDEDRVAEQRRPGLRRMRRSVPATT
jgi:hypothetical protein